MSPEISNPQKPSNFFSVLLLSAAIVVLWLIPVFVSGSPGLTAGTGAWGIVSIIALLLTIIAPIVYGWFSRNETGAILIGVVPFLLTTGVSRIVSGNTPPGIDYLIYSVIYVASLSLTGGLEGFFAAKKTAGTLLIALVLAGIWTGIFLSGIR
ncbi:MAG: hypothetical protein WC593_03750 [Methanoregula sp.]